MRKISLLRVIGGLDPGIGGPSESSLNACIASQRAGVMNSFAFPVAEHATEAVGPVRQRLKDEGIAVHTFPLIPASSHRAERWGVSPALVRWVLRNASMHDVVHVHGAWGLASFAGVLAASRAKVPSVMTPHESMTRYDVRRPGNRVRIVAKSSLKAFYRRRLALLVFASQLEAQDTLSGAGQSRAAVVHHPLRSALQARPPVPSRSPGPLVVGYLGRLHPKKNLETLIRAVKAASDDARLLIAGDGVKDYVDTLVRLADDVGMTNRTEWHGFLEGDRRWPFIDALDVFAMPSHFECFGMAGAEAMARGIPTIVSQSTGLAEIIQRHASGIIAPPNIDGLARAIQGLDQDRDFLFALKARSLSVASLELSMERYAEVMVPHYERLIGGDTSA